jgi:hypothetical protein
MSGSYHIEYTPPQGTKYKWGPPPLKHSPIYCIVECLTWPQALDIFVDKFEQGYQGYLSFSSINLGPVVRKRTRFYKKALSACRAIEKMGDELLKADIQPWMRKALKLKWRPPAMNQNDE